MSRMRQMQRRAGKRPVVAARAPALAPQETVEVRVKFMGELPAVVGARSVALSLPPASTVQDLLAHLSATYGETFTARVFSSSGKLHHYIIVFVDGAKVDMPAGLQRTLGRGEVDVVMLPMFAGG
ncbi:MAG: MoaD/ThiS family protein [Hyphomicrobiales bacterium]|nr:MoaD/ThiS family protein [Hyphomicrobiales bacterium]